MRILHVTPYFESAWAYGGIPRAAACMVQGLMTRGHRVTVCTTDACRPDSRLPAPDGAAVPSDGSADVRVFRNLSNAAAYHLQFFLPMGLGRYLSSHAGEFDIAHLHGCHHVPGSVAARHLRLANVPYLVTPNGTAPYIERRRTAKRLFDATIGHGMLSGAAHVTAVSVAERKQLLHLGVPAADISVIPNPVDISEFSNVRRGAFRRRMQIGDDERIVLYLGKLTPRKRLDTLVEAFAGLPASGTRLVIAGNDMGFGRTLQKLIDRFGLQERTILTGLLTGHERLDALADADVVAYASELEVFGIVAVEALLCGTPVVVADDSGCGEVVTEVGGGLVVPPGDPVRLRAAIATILGDLETWRLKAAGAGERCERYSSDHVAAALETTYARVIASTREPRLRAAV